MGNQIGARATWEVQTAAVVQCTTGTEIETETEGIKISPSRLPGLIPGSGNRWWSPPEYALYQYFGLRLCPRVGPWEAQAMQSGQ